MTKYLVLVALVISLLFCSEALAQEKFDIVSFKAPAGWQKSVEQNAVQFSKQEGSGVGIMMLFKAMPTGKDPRQTFDASWNTIVKGLFDKVDAPQMQPAGNENGWTLENGAAVVEKDGSKAVANLISASGGGKVVNLLIIYNSESFQPAIDAFIGSINLPRVQATGAQTTQTTAGTNSANPSSIAGLWVFYNTESGGVVNGIHQLTGGYMRREYLLKADGTYQFRAKDWMVYVKDILYISESGTWSVSGNKLTIRPTKGKGEWWSKSASNRTSEWGRFVRASDYKLEPVTYSFELFQPEGMQEMVLMLRSGSSTQRDGNRSDNTYRYTSRALDRSLIDDPPR